MLKPVHDLGTTGIELVTVISNRMFKFIDPTEGGNIVHDLFQ